MGENQVPIHRLPSLTYILVWIIQEMYIVTRTSNLFFIHISIVCVTSNYCAVYESKTNIVFCFKINIFKKNLDIKYILYWNGNLSYFHCAWIVLFFARNKNPYKNGITFALPFQDFMCVCFFFLLNSVSIWNVWKTVPFFGQSLSLRIFEFFDYAKCKYEFYFTTEICINTHMIAKYH